MAADIVDQIFTTILLGGNLKELVGRDVVDVNGLRTAAARAEHEVHEVVVVVDGILLAVPVLTADAGSCRHLVARPAAVGDRKSVV